MASNPAKARHGGAEVEAEAGLGEYANVSGVEIIQRLHKVLCAPIPAPELGHHAAGPTSSAFFTLWMSPHHSTPSIPTQCFVAEGDSAANTLSTSPCSGTRS